MNPSIRTTIGAGALATGLAALAALAVGAPTWLPITLIVLMLPEIAALTLRDRKAQA